MVVGEVLFKTLLKIQSSPYPKSGLNMPKGRVFRNISSNNSNSLVQKVSLKPLYVSVSTSTTLVRNSSGSLSQTATFKLLAPLVAMLTDGLISLTMDLGLTHTTVTILLSMPSCNLTDMTDLPPAKLVISTLFNHTSITLEPQQPVSMFIPLLLNLRSISLQGR